MAFSSRISLLARHLHNSTHKMTTEKATFAAGCFWQVLISFEVV
jgi:hypothetical protein